MILNSRNNLFFFEFPKGFIPQFVIDKYKPYLNRIPGNLLEEPLDLINYTIQGVTTPTLGFDPPELGTNDGTSIYFRGALPTQNIIGREFSVTMQLIDGYINYWIMLETLLFYHHDTQKENDYLPPFSLRFLDSEGNALVNMKLVEPIYKNISEITLSYSANSPEFETFQVDFNYNLLELNVELD